MDVDRRVEGTISGRSVARTRSDFLAAWGRLPLGRALGLVFLGVVAGCSRGVVIPAAECPYDRVDYTAVSENEIRVKITAALEGCGLRSIGEEQLATLDESAKARVLRCSFTSSYSSVQRAEVEVKPPPSFEGGTTPTVQVRSKYNLTEVWADVALSDSRGRPIYSARGTVEPSPQARATWAYVLVAADKALQKLTANCHREGE